MLKNKEHREKKKKVEEQSVRVLAMVKKSRWDRAFSEQKVLAKQSQKTYIMQQGKGVSKKI